MGYRQRRRRGLCCLCLRGTINNIDNIGLPNCLTGPIARGDLGTIERHLSALEAKNPSLLTTYKELGLQTIPIALAKGKINEHKAEEIKALLSLKRKVTKKFMPREVENENYAEK